MFEFRKPNGPLLAACLRKKERKVELVVVNKTANKVDLYHSENKLKIRGIVKYTIRPTPSFLL